jgi:hypothetical protein
MERMRKRLSTVAVTVVVVLAVGYWAADNNVVFGPTVHVRNETASLAWVELDGLNDDGDDKMSVPAWKSGMCPSGSWTWHHHGVPAAAGNGTVVRLAEPGSATTVPLTQFADGAPLFVRIDSSGVVRTGEPVPDDPPGCASYTIRDGWSWHFGE